MGRGGKVGGRRNFRQRFRSKGGSSDDSDEDYVISEGENEVTDDDYGEFCSLDGDVEEEQDEEEEVVRKPVRSKAKKGSSKKRNVRRRTSQKRNKRVSDDDEYEAEEDYSDESDADKESNTRRKVLHKRNRRVSDDDDDEEDEVEEDYSDEGDADKESNIRHKVSLKRKRVSDSDGDDGDEDYNVEGDDVNDDDEDFSFDEDDNLDDGDADNDGDEDFCFDEIDDSDEDDELPPKKKKNSMKGVRQGRLRNSSARGAKRRKKSRVSKKPSRRKKGNKRGSRNKASSDDDEPILRENVRKTSGRRRRRYTVASDSDFETQELSEYEYTISEEERQQVREAGELCRSLATGLRSSPTLKSTEDDTISQQRTPSLRKGKEKVEEATKEVAKQVCGICLSEEDKRRVRGTLDCCSHYFCFTCIMEWSKVESRCPLCKQRFRTISKPARSSSGIDLRSVAVQVPERDQVYQPSEEEIRGYMDPYENVICTECHQGGDDNLMLLCDLCDSPAHTYCVGLGQEVPEGNWYCDGCRPVALGSSSTQVQEISSDQRVIGNNFSNGPSPRGGLDLNSFPSPHDPSFQGLGNLSSPRFPTGDVQTASPASGPGAPTLSRRRWIHNHIQNLLSSNRMEFLANRADVNAAATSARDLLTAQLNVGRGTSIQHTGALHVGTLYTPPAENLLNNPSTPLQNQDIFPSRIGNLRSQAVEDQNIARAERSVRETLWDDLRGITSSGFGQQYQGNSISSMGSDGSLSPCLAREGSRFYEAKEQLQSMVKDHLKSLSRDINLGHNTFKEISRSSTHTILAACGLEHRRNEVYPVAPPSACPHIEALVIGQTSLMKGYCLSCFDSYVRDVVKTILNSRLPSWLVGSRA